MLQPMPTSLMEMPPPAPRPAMNSSPSVSDAEARDAYDRLAPEIRRWIREQGWARLRDVQVQGVTAVLGTDCDVLIAAAQLSVKPSRRGLVSPKLTGVPEDLRIVRLVQTPER